jgi:tetratricopeptide (TPR) repeat protein
MVKKISITGRMHINTLILEHLDTVKLFDYTSFSNWYCHTIINHEASQMSQLIGEVYNVAFNDYLQLLIQYGIIPCCIFIVFNVYILYILIKRKKGLSTVCFLLLNLMLLTSYPLFMSASLCFLLLVYTEIIKKEKLFKFNSSLENGFFKNVISIKVITVLLVCMLGVVYYYPKFILFKNIPKTDSIATLLNTKLTKYAFRNDEIKYWIAKEYISKDSKNAKRILLYLNDKNLSYNMLLFTGEVFEHLGQYEEAVNYYEKSHVVRPFTLLPIYKQLLIHNHLQKKEEVYALLHFYKNMQIRVNNEHTAIMQSEINELIKTYN